MLSLLLKRFFFEYNLRRRNMLEYEKFHGTITTWCNFESSLAPQREAYPSDAVLLPMAFVHKPLVPLAETLDFFSAATAYPNDSFALVSVRPLLNIF